MRSTTEEHRRRVDHAGKIGGGVTQERKAGETNQENQKHKEN